MAQYKKVASFIFTLHLAEKWRHPAADLRGYKTLLQFTIFSSNKSINYFYLKMKDAQKSKVFLRSHVLSPFVSFPGRAWERKKFVMLLLITFLCCTQQEW